MPALTQQQLESHLWGAADILRGSVDAGAYMTYIFALLFYKRLNDVWEEEYEAVLNETGDKAEAADPIEHRFHIPPGHFWKDIRKSATDIGQCLNNAFHAIEDENLRLKGVFQDVDFANKERFPDATIEKLLVHFEKHRLRNTDAPGDMLGDAYQYLIKMFAEGSGKKGGEFYTPQMVTRLIVECLEPEEGMSIYDPTCGSAGMLLEAAAYIKRKGGDPRRLALYGQEKNLNTWAIAQINLFLHNIDDAFIAKGDTLLTPQRYDGDKKEFVSGLAEYDRVLANPPFSQKQWGHEVWTKGDNFGRDDYGCPPKSYGDLAFVQHMIASLKPDGRLGVVLPHGVLFRAGAEGKIREKMLKADIIEAVIGLAPNLFYGAGIPACILLINKKKPNERKNHVLIVNGAETYREGKAQNTLTETHIEALSGAYLNWETTDKLSRPVPLDEIEDNGWNLNLSRYVQTGPDAEEIDVTAEVAKLKDLIAERDKAEAEMMKHLEALGYGV